MSVIDKVIQPQAFEVVRDRIGRILVIELDNQFQIGYNLDLRAQVWIERFLQFDKPELPAVNVMLAEGTYDNQTSVQTHGTYRYYVDVYVNGKANDDDPGDVRAMLKLQRLLGVCRSIIEDPRYITLGFGVRPGFVMNRHFESIQIQNPKQKEHDATNSVMGRLTLSVRVPEYPVGRDLIILTESKTTIKLIETEKGFLWVNNSSTIYNLDYSND